LTRAAFMKGECMEETPSVRYNNSLRNHTSYVYNTRQNLQEILYWRF